MHDLPVDANVKERPIKCECCMHELQRKENFKARGKGKIIEYKIKHFYHFRNLENSDLVYIYTIQGF